MSDVPKGFDGAYTEQDGKAVFIGGDFEFKNESDVLAMETAKGHVKAELAEVKEKLKTFDGIDIEQYKKDVEEMDVLRAKVKDGGNDEETIKAIVDARVARATEELNNKNGELSKQLEEANGFRLKTEKQSILNDVLRKNVSESAIQDAEFIIGSAIERQADGTYMSNGMAGFEKGLSVEDLVTKAIESRSHWQKQNNAGQGASGATGQNASNGMAKFNELKTKVESGSATRQETQEYIQVAEQVANEARTNTGD